MLSEWFLKILSSYILLRVKKSNGRASEGQFHEWWWSNAQSAFPGCFKIPNVSRDYNIQLYVLCPNYLPKCPTFGSCWSFVETTFIISKYICYDRTLAYLYSCSNYFHFISEFQSTVFLIIETKHFKIIVNMPTETCNSTTEGPTTLAKTSTLRKVLRLLAALLILVISLICGSCSSVLPARIGMFVHDLAFNIAHNLNN